MNKPDQTQSGFLAMNVELLLTALLLAILANELYLMASYMHTRYILKNGMLLCNWPSFDALHQS
jgi:hypothetical protein